MSAFVELNMDQGATFNNIIYLNDDITGVSINLSGYLVQSQMRKSYYSNTDEQLVCTITDAANGVITLSLDAANTALLDDGKYVFDMKLTDPVGVVTRILEGIVTVSPEVTR